MRRAKKYSIKSLVIVVVLGMFFASALVAGPENDKLWITRLDNDAGFQIVVPDLGVRQTFSDPLAAVEHVFSNIGAADKEIERLETELSGLQVRAQELQAQLMIAQEQSVTAAGYKRIYEVAKDAAGMFTRQTFWEEKYGPIKEVAVTDLMYGKHRVAFAWSRMHPERSAVDGDDSGAEIFLEEFSRIIWGNEDD